MKKHVGNRVVSDFRIDNSTLFSILENKLSEALPLVDWTGIEDKDRLIEWVKKSSKKNTQHIKLKLRAYCRSSLANQIQ